MGEEFTRKQATLETEIKVGEELGGLEEIKDVPWS